MTNFAAQIKAEIARVVRKETKSDLELQRKNAIKQRLDLSQVKKQLKELASQVKLLQRQVVRQAKEPEATAKPDVPFGPAQLTELRRKFGLTQAQMARLLGVSTPSYSKYEAGKAQPRTAKLIRIVELMALSKGAALTRLKNLDKA